MKHSWLFSQVDFPNIQKRGVYFLRTATGTAVSVLWMSHTHEKPSVCQLLGLNVLNIPQDQLGFTQKAERWFETKHP